MRIEPGYCKKCGAECIARIVIAEYSTVNGKPYTTKAYRCPKERMWNFHRRSYWWDDGIVLEEHQPEEEL